MPATLTIILDVVAPVLQRKVAPEFAANKVESPVHIALSPTMATDAFEKQSTYWDKLAVQPALLVPVTV
jgi:hypothetical protein